MKKASLQIGRRISLIEAAEGVVAGVGVIEVEGDEVAGVIEVEGDAVDGAIEVGGVDLEADVQMNIREIEVVDVVGLEGVVEEGLEEMMNLVKVAAVEEGSETLSAEAIAVDAAALENHLMVIAVVEEILIVAVVEGVVVLIIVFPVQQKIRKLHLTIKSLMF